MDKFITAHDQSTLVIADEIFCLCEQIQLNYKSRNIIESRVQLAAGCSWYLGVTDYY